MKKNLILILLLICQYKLLSQIPDLGKLKTENGNKVRYISIGSSLSAGVRNGGVYLASQQTSFPNLIAQQMGIVDFRQPLLEKNGTGYESVMLDKNNNLKFQKIVGLDESKKLPKIINEIDNFALPYLKVLDIYEPVSDNNPFVDKKSFKYLDRLISTEEEGKVSYLKYLSRVQNIDFFTYELGFHDYIQYIKSGGLGTSIIYMGARENYGEIELLNILTSKNTKGVIANIPDVLDFPIFRFNTLKKLQKANSTNEIFISYLAKSGVRIANNLDIFLPTQNISDLMDNTISDTQKLGLKPDSPLNDSDVLSIDEIETISVKGYNKTIIEPLSQKYQLPIVDLYSLYKGILKGNYITDDGVLINPSYPNGNFFSSDGITPTALGHAVIANEFIKVINLHFNAKIPLIQTTKIIEK
ncbi:MULTISPECIES: hypothetical protein [unclassified Arcicella]|uniref:hypothetical protein n=1 Tax=unclassified Arcicella TaxID=2644986 RepID=UPI00285F94F1|nr:MULTISPECIES: hypothetical protein [unclassified Arcicella]MDR6560210.1 hypothetical protein [Arcicella sp. BE51]MDR6810184.1 hypothetical protein [Arcicella sp. BE140]MDR6821533.1 hypothetical protein [Arcicella sp. BE139]